MESVEAALALLQRRGFTAASQALLDELSTQTKPASDIEGLEEGYQALGKFVENSLDAIKLGIVLLLLREEKQVKI